MRGKNEGSVDRFVRVLAGLVVVGLSYFGSHSWLAILGMILLITGLVGFCPIYRLFGVETCKAQS